MKSYQNVLCATDCSDFCIIAAERASEMTLMLLSSDRQRFLERQE